MTERITFAELAAIILCRGRLLIITALVFAILLGGVQTARLMPYFSSAPSAEAVAEYEEALSEYENELASLELRLENSELALENQLIYNQDSILMQIDPYNEIYSAISISVVDPGSDALYHSSSIMNQYVVYWNSFDIGSLSDIAEEKYLREILRVTLTDGCLLIEARGTSEADTQALMEKAYNTIIGAKPTITAAMGEHELLITSNTTKTQVNSTLMEFQKAKHNAVDEREKEIVSIEDKIKNLTAPTAPTGYTFAVVAKSVVKWLILGAFVGIFLGAVYVLAIYLLRGYVENSHRLERGLKSSFIGSLALPKDIFGRLADHICGERVWKSKDDALRFLEDNASVYLDNAENVALVSTMDLANDDEAVRNAISAIRAADCNVQYIGNARTNAKLLSTLKDCDTVVMLERVYSSEWRIVCETEAQIRKMGKEISGFILA